KMLRVSSAAAISKKEDFATAFKAITNNRRRLGNQRSAITGQLVFKVGAFPQSGNDMSDGRFSIHRGFQTDGGTGAAEHLRFSRENRNLSQRLVKDSRQGGRAIHARFPSCQPNSFWIQLYFPGSFGTSRLPPRDAASSRACSKRSKRSG